jgi:hypothetical protein
MYGRPDTVRAHQIRAHYGELINGLHMLQPKKRRSFISWIVLSGCVYFLGALGTDTSVREAMFAPHIPARAPQFVADAPRGQQLPTVVSMPAFAVPAAPQFGQPGQPGQPVAAAPVAAQPVAAAQPIPVGAAPGAAPQPVPTFAPVDVPPQAHHTGTTKRVHSRKHK